VSFLLRLGSFAVTIAAGTAVGGWWTVPVLTAVWVRALRRHQPSGAFYMAGAASGWALLLGWAAAQGPIVAVARKAGGVLQLPWWGMILLTLCFPALLAGAAARVARRGVSR
jgi:hypothetical protein